MNKYSPLIVSFSGDTLTEKDRDIFSRINPIGFILFKENCKNADQLKALCLELAAFSPLEKPLIFIDQEGGRIVRIDWEEYIAPAGRAFGEVYEQDAPLALELAKLNGFVLAAQLQEYGITVNCLPVADVAVEGAHDVIGDRAFSRDPKVVAELCEATMSGMLEGGNWPIIKHAPGHGRALSDSHLELPVVEVSEEELMQTDFLPFKENKDAPFIMTAHILYPQLDKEKCATQSSYVLQNVLRQKMGLGGLIVSDALDMEALSGSLKERAENSLSAGCDLLLHCSRNVDELEDLMELPAVSEEVFNKLKRLPQFTKPSAQKVNDARQKLQSFFNKQKISA